MKVLILSNYANGLILFRKEILETFVNKGWETLVSVPIDENCSKISDIGCRLCPVELERRGMNPIKDSKLLLQYFNLIKKEKPDVVLTYTIKPNLYGGLACRIHKVPYLMNITGLGTSLENPGILEKILLFLYRFVAKKANCVFFQNESNREFMKQRKIAVNNSCLLPGSGVNLEEHPMEEYPTEEQGIHILAVLRVMKDKGIAEYLEAAENIKKKHNKVFFHLAGAYEEETRKEYEPWIQRLEQQGVLQYYGLIDYVPELMAKCHIIAHPSYHEGLSNVLLEAAACGRPVLASDVPGCRETVKKEVSGILFQARNTQSLIEAMDKVLSYSEETRRQMGIEGRRYVEEYFDRKRVIDRYMAEIRKALGTTTETN